MGLMNQMSEWGRLSSEKLGINSGEDHIESEEDCEGDISKTVRKITRVSLCLAVSESCNSGAAGLRLFAPLL